MTVTDDAGRKVEIARAPLRIVSLAPSNTELLFAVGAVDKVVGVDEFSNFPAEARAKPQLGSYIKPDLERIVAAGPDLVLVTNVHVKTLVPELESRKIPALVVDGTNVEEVFERILLVGRVTGDPAKAATVVASMKARMATVASRVSGQPKTRVFFELSPDLYTAGPKTFVDDLIQRAGGQNIAADAKTQWPQLNQESVIQKDPEVIILSYGAGGPSPDQVKARPGWQNLAAIKGSRVTTVNPDLTNRPGPRVIDGLEAIAAALHPDRFR